MKYLNSFKLSKDDPESTYDPKFEGSNNDTTRKGREKIANNFCQKVQVCEKSLEIKWWHQAYIITQFNGTECFKNVNNCLNTNIYSYLETSGSQSSNLYLKAAHFFNSSVN